MGGQEFNWNDAWLSMERMLSYLPAENFIKKEYYGIGSQKEKGPSLRFDYGVHDGYDEEEHWRSGCIYEAKSGSPSELMPSQVSAKVPDYHRISEYVQVRTAPCIATSATKVASGIVHKKDEEEGGGFEILDWDSRNSTDSCSRISDTT